jgi:hypothetical protein
MIIFEVLLASIFVIKCDFVTIIVGIHVKYSLITITIITLIIITITTIAKNATIYTKHLQFLHFSPIF